MHQFWRRGTAMLVLTALLVGLVSGVPMPKAFAASQITDHVQTADEINLAPNPGFEELDANGNLIGWSNWGTKSHVVVDGRQSPDEVYDGRYALKITDGNNAASVGVQSDVFAIEPGMTYRLSVYAMELEVGTTFQAYIYYGHYETVDGVRKFVRDTAVYINTTGTGEWNYCEVTGIAPEISTHARVLLVSGGAATGQTCYDSVSFTKVGMAQYIPVSFDGNWELL